MTDEEKQRLNELLIDLEEFDTNKQKVCLSEGGEENPTLIVEYNPFTVSLMQGDGFTPDKIDSERLREIDTRLEKRNFSRLTSFGNDIKSSAHSSFSKISKSAISSHNVDAESYYGLTVDNFILI